MMLKRIIRKPHIGINLTNFIGAYIRRVIKKAPRLVYLKH